MPRHLAVGVVADERAVRDRVVEPPLRGGHSRLEPRGHVLDVVVQRAELALQAGGVGDEVVRAALAEHDALIGPHAAEPQREDETAEQGDEGGPGGGESDDAGGAVEVVHGPQDRWQGRRDGDRSRLRRSLTGLARRT